MTPLEKPQTAHDLDLMRGFPPPADRLVTHTNQLLAPYNRWSFQNELLLNPVVDVWRGSGAAVPLEYAPADLSRVTYRNRAGTQFSFEDMVELSYTDGILVLQHGKVIYQRYLNGMQAHTLHCWASGSKSMTGTLAALLAHEGLFDPGALVTDYLPELAGSGFAGATLRQVMDMTAAVRFPAGDADPVTESTSYGIALGWQAIPAGYTGPLGVSAFLPTMKNNGVHGEKFTYMTVHSDVLAWLIKRLTGKTLAEIMRERIWSLLGVDRDAFWIVDPTAAETAGSGLLTTLPDMARFGQMLLQNGEFNGRRILPAAVVTDIAAGGDPQAFARGPAAGPGNQGWSYHHQWWLTHNPHGAYQAIGYGGQMLYIDPAVQMVIAKFSSYPTPTPAGNEFFSAFAAFPALALALDAGDRGLPAL